jgi:hypothetical protein
MSDSQTVLCFPLLPGHPVQVEFTGGRLSSDGGLPLLAQLDRRLRLTERVAACLRDPRRADRVQHPLLDLIRQRLYQIAAGYEDANDATTLRRDPALKIAVGRRPQTDPDLASQPTLSRLEQQVKAAECEAINHLLLDLFLEQARPEPQEIVLDFDPSEDPTHGQQELAFYHGYYRCYCYLPLFVFARVRGEGEQYLVSAQLLPSKPKDNQAILTTLQRLVAALRARFPGVRLIFRGDSWFATPALYDWCETNDVAYVIGLRGNPILQEQSQPWRAAAQAAAQAAALNGPCGSRRRFGEFDYQAVSWRQARRVVVKAEHNALGANTRYVVSFGLAAKAARAVYRYYGQRGNCENRIKELKAGVKADRTSCHRFTANQFRLLLAALAYVLFQALRTLARRTGLARAQVEQLRLALIKIAAQVTESRRRVLIQLCRHCPSQALWQRLWRRLGLDTS